MCSRALGNHMAIKPSREELLADAGEAEKRAQAATDRTEQESWRRIAQSYRELAAHTPEPSR